MKTRVRALHVCVAASLVAVLAGPAASAVAATPADLSMSGFSPASGPVGAVVKITGTGFVGGDQVRFNGTLATTVAANRAGTKLKATVPPLATSGPITVTDPATGQTVGLPGTTFLVTTGLDVLPGHAWAGQDVTVAGSGLTPFADEQIHLGKGVLSNVRVGADGTFVIGVQVPWDEHSGKIKVWVLDPSWGQVHSIFFLFDEWPQFHHDLAHTGYDTLENTISPSNVSGLTAKWTELISGVVASSPTVAGGLVYVGGAGLYAYDASTGSPKWTYPTSDLVESTPAEAGGRVYFGCDDKNVYAVDAGTGAFDWSFATGDRVNSSPAVSGGLVYVGSQDGNLYALNQATGAKVWSYATGEIFDSSPAVAGGVVYVGSANGSLYALNAKTGAFKWSFATGGSVFSSPAVANGIVYFGSDDGRVWAVNALNGGFDWFYSTGTDEDYVDSSPAVANGVVYIGSYSQSLYALNATTGALKWSFPLSNIVTDSPAVANGVVYVGSWDLKVYAFDASSGSILWFYLTADYLRGSPAVANGRVYAATSDGVRSFGL